MTMECRDVRPLAESFVTEQLLVETAQRIVTHLERCAACRAEVDGLRRLRAATRRAFELSPDLQVSPAFVDGVHARLRAQAVRPSRGSVLRRWGALAAMLILLAGGGFALRAWSALGFAAVLHAAAGDHRFCALTYALAERPIPLAEAARRYDPAYAALETVDPVPATLPGGPVRVLERHSCLYAGHRFAHIVVRYKTRPASILVAERDSIGSLFGVGPATGAGVQPMPATAGFHVAAFRAGGRSVFVVSSLDQPDVQDLAAALAGPITKAVAGR